MNPDQIKNESFFKLAKQTASIYSVQLKKYPLQLTLAIVMLPFGVISLNIISTLIGSMMIDQVASDSYRPELGLWKEYGGIIILFTVNAFVGNSVWRVNGFVFSDFHTKAIRDLELRVFSWMSGHSYSFYANSFSGALVAQHKRFIGSFERIVDMLYWDIYRTVVLLIFTISVVTYYAPIIGVLMFVWSCIFTAISVWLNVKKSKYSRIFAASDSRVTATIADFITNILTVKVFSSAKPELKSFADKTDTKRLQFRKVMWFNEWIFAVQGIMIVGSHAFVWMLSLNMYHNGDISLGILLLIWLYWRQLLRELFFVGRFVGRIEYALSDAAEMTKILTMPHDVEDPESPEKLRIKNGEIVLKNVDFSYEKGRKLFKKLNITIPAGQKVGLVGPSGGGKTTITKLLLRFTDIQNGTITIDGQDISKITQDDARSIVSYVPQEPLLFHRSITDNIGYSQDERSMKQIKLAAKHARADIFIDKLSDGYDTLVGERGVKLSGGEKQRIAIARAILKDSPILMLDEATSALDSESEKLIQEAFEDIMENKTAIVIAHRLSTIQKLDRILVIDDGEIVEDGSHDELIKNKGLYSELWSHQTGGFLE